MWVTLFMALTGSVVSAQQFERGGTRPEETGRLVDTQPPAPSGRGLGPVYRTPDPKELSLLHDWYPYRTIPPFGNPAIADAPDVVYPGSARFRITDGTKLPAELKIQLDRRSEFPAGYYIVHFRDGVDEDPEDRVPLQRFHGGAGLLLDLVVGAASRELFAGDTSEQRNDVLAACSRVRFCPVTLFLRSWLCPVTLFLRSWEFLTAALPWTSFP